MRAIGRSCGLLYYIFNNRRVDIARYNLKLCYPQLSQEKREKIVKNQCMQAGMWVMEAGAAWGWTPEKAMKKMTIRNERTLLDAEASGRGVIVGIPHLGNWEMLNHYFCSRHEMTALFKPDDKQPALTEFILEQRNRNGIIMAPADKRGIRALIKSLRSGRLVALLPDHIPSEGMGVYAPFYGHPAYTDTLISSLARKHDAIVLLATALRTKNGFDIVFDVVKNQSSEDPCQAAKGINEAVETAINRAPSQFQWMYGRFKKQPADSSLNYP